MSLEKARKQLELQLRSIAGRERLIALWWKECCGVEFGSATYPVPPTFAEMIDAIIDRRSENESRR